MSNTTDDRTCAGCKYCYFEDSEFPCCECTNNTDYFEEKESNWIPCSERLPERDVDVLVTDRVTGTVGIAHLNLCDCFAFEDGRGHGVSAWMPLPEPYKEGGLIG